MRLNAELVALTMATIIGEQVVSYYHIAGAHLFASKQMVWDGSAKWVGDRTARQTLMTTSSKSTAASNSA